MTLRTFWTVTLGLLLMLYGIGYLGAQAVPVAGSLKVSSIDTSAELATILTDETGSGGGFVRATSPTLATPITTGDIVHQSAANAAAINVRAATTTVTCNSGTASCTASNLIPAGATVVSVTARVTTILAGTGLTTWSLGDGVTTDLWATGKALAADTTVSATGHKSTWNIKFFSAANNVVLTAAAGQFDSGVVRLTVFYFDSTAPTS